MEGAVRVALRSRGDDPRNFALVAFGGAGPLHAAELARRLAIDTVVVPPHPGTLSALGLLTADVRLDFAVSELHSNSERSLAETLLARFGALAEQARDEVESDSQLRARPYTTTYSCDVRYRGQAYEVSVPSSSVRSPTAVSTLCSIASTSCINVPTVSRALPTNVR